MGHRLGWFVVAERIIIGDDGNFSVINTLERITGAALPVVFGPIHYGAVFHLDDAAMGTDSIHLRIGVERPDGRRVVFIEPSTRVDPARPLRIRVPHAGVSFSIAGRHHFYLEREVDGEWVTEARWPVEILVDPDLIQHLQTQDPGPATGSDIPAPP